MCPQEIHLPLLPLGIVIFPNEQVSLHIFEPRYKQLLAECIENKKTFGVCTLLNGRVFEIGTEVKISGINFIHPNGSIEIRITGIKRFEIKNYYNHAEGKLYPAGDILSFESQQENFEEFSDILEDKIKELLRLNYLYFEIPKNRYGTISSFDIGHIIGLSTSDRYDLIKENSEAQRKLLIIKKLDVIIDTLRNIEAAKERLRYNGSYKIIINPDKKDEL